MLDPTALPLFIDLAAYAVVPLVFLVLAARAVLRALPSWIPYRFLGRAFLVVGGIALVAAGVGALADRSPLLLIGGWLGLGLVASVIEWWRRTADARAKEAERLRAARGHERRRAQPPVGGAPAPRMPAAPRRTAP